MRRVAQISALAVVTLLAACSSPPQQVEQRQTIQGSAPTTVFGQPQAASLVLVDRDTLTVGSLIEAMPGIWSTPIYGVATNGSFTIQLPTETELPAGLLKPDDQFLYVGGATCVTQSSVPEARFTQLFASGDIAPLVSFYGFGYSMPTLTTDRAPDPDNGFSHFVSWVYSTADTTVTAEAGDCETASTTAVVNLNLQAGWNQVLIHIDWDEDTEEATLTFSNSTATNLRFYID